jgi:hypothetical protein
MQSAPKNYQTSAPKDPQFVACQAEPVLCGRERWPTARPGNPSQELRTAAGVIREREPVQCPDVIVSVVRLIATYAVSSPPASAHELWWWRTKTGNKSLGCRVLSAQWRNFGHFDCLSYAVECISTRRVTFRSEELVCGDDIVIHSDRLEHSN